MMKWNIKQALLTFLIFLFILGGLYLLTLFFPGIFFKDIVQVENLKLYSNGEKQENVISVANIALSKIKNSPLYDPQLVYKVFLCDTVFCFTYFANTNKNVGGIAYIYFNGNTFIRPSDVTQNKIIRASGVLLDDPDRPLSYYIAHEVTHAMTVNEVGRLRYFNLPVWVQEGYADYVAKGSLNFEDARERLRSNEREFNPEESGLYLRYHLMVQYLLEEKGATVEELLQNNEEIKDIVYELLE